MQQIKKWYPCAPQDVRMEYTTLGIPGTPNPESIVGVSTVCPSNTIFSIQGLPTNATVAWSATPVGLFSNDNGNNTTFTTSATNGSTSGQGTITAIVSRACGDIELTKNVTVGTPISFSWQGPGPYGQLDVSVFGGSSPFKFYKNGTLIHTSSFSEATIPFGCDGGTLKVEASTSCGVSSSTQLIPSGCPSFYLVYPNPSTNEVNVASPELEKSFDYGPEVMDEVIYLTLSNDQGETVQINTFSSSKGKKINLVGLRRGIYYLRIKSLRVDEVHRIVLE